MIVKVEFLSRFLVRIAYGIFLLSILFIVLDAHELLAFVQGVLLGMFLVNLYAIRKSIVDKRYN